jgi:cytochrome P450
LKTALSPKTIDFIDPDFFLTGEQHEAWRLLRAEDPVHWNPGRTLTLRSGREAEHKGFWNVTKYDDIFRISRDPAGFISGKGIALTFEPSAEVAAQIESMRSSGMQMPDMMIQTDPPRHTKQRQIVNKGFTPRAIGLIESHVRDITRKILDDLQGRNECDFVTDVAAKLPLAVICELLGIPEKDWQLVFDLSNRMLGSDDPEYQNGPGEDVMQFVFYGLFKNLIDERRAEPKDDLLTILGLAEIDEKPLDYMELVLFGVLLMVAGNETTRNATSGGMLALLQHPDQLARLCEDHSLLPTAIEEILRWTSPVMHMTRVATRDYNLRGKTIKTGDRVAMWYPSANRDEDVFPESMTFDIARQPNEHIAFGVGEHFCLGANLARQELRVILSEVMTRMDGIELAGEPEKLRSNFIGGIKHMPVSFKLR